jgi:xylulokinase
MNKREQQMAEPLLIGIDLGTTNGKVACYDLKGQLLAEAAHAYPTQHPLPGWAEQNPADWMDALTKGLQEVAAQLGSRVVDVAGISVSTFGPGLLIVDRDGNPMAPCPTWQDERCLLYGQKILSDIGHDWIDLGSPSGFPSKLLWALKEQPDLMERAHQVEDVKGFMLRWLTGRSVTEPSSGPGAKDWWPHVFDYIGWPIDRLPQIIPSIESPGGLLKDLARRIGFKPGIPVFAGINDGAAATLGSGVVRLGDSVVTLGTNGVARVLTAERMNSDAILTHYLFSRPFDDQLWLCGGFTRSGASSLQWLADLLGVPRDPEAYDVLLAEAAKVPPGSKGVIFLPYLSGRGTPKPDPDARAGFVNLSLEHSRAELTRAVLEGIAYAIREIFDLFADLGLHIGPLRLTGGGARSILWRQIMVDVLNRPATLAGGDSTLGDAMLAAVGLGLYPDFETAADAMVKSFEHDEPDPKAVASYERLYRSFAEVRNRNDSTV